MYYGEVTLSSEHLIRITSLTYGGDAMGRLPDGRAVFVPFALPGEHVRVALTEEKRAYAHARLVEIVEPSPERILPRCRHFGHCGGCHYQHLTYERQLQVKTHILREQLIRIGHVPDPPIQPIVPSPRAWNYRNHVQFHLTSEGRLGYVFPLPELTCAPDSNSPTVCPIDECHLPEEGLNALWPSLEFEPGLHLDRVSVRLGAGDQAMLILESASLPLVEIETDLSVVHLYRDHAVVLAGQEYLTFQVRERLFRVSAGSFFQVNTPMAEKMVEHLLEHLPVDRSTMLLDIYCGVGLFAAFFAPRCGRLIGIEASPAACDDFVVNLDEFDHVTLYQGTAEQVLPALAETLPAKSVVIVDPPRAGLHRTALDALLRLRPAYLAYVSCDPATLARDTARLIRGGYRLNQVTPFDLFPQTYHIESISLFTAS